MIHGNGKATTQMVMLNKQKSASFTDGMFISERGVYFFVPLHYSARGKTLMLKWAHSCVIGGF